MITNRGRMTSLDDQINTAFEIHRKLQVIDNKILLDALAVSLKERQKG